MIAEHLSREKDVIEKAYEVTTNPEILDEFEKYWEAYIDSRLQKDSEREVNLNDEPINAHILRAIEIIERMGVLKSLNAHAQTLVDRNYGLGFIVNQEGQIIAQNQDALKFVKGSLNLNELNFDKPSLSEISKWIKKDRNIDGGDVLFKDVTIKGQNQTICLFIKPLKLIRELAASNQFHFLITAVDFIIDPETVQAIRKRYDLSKAESEIAISLANGMNNSEIANERKVLKSTVDKQVKQIRAKTGTRSIVDLVRQLTQMSFKMTSVSSQVSRERRSRRVKIGMIRRSKINLKDGREYEFIEQGHPRGEPVLHIHTLLSSGELIPSSEKKCVLKGWRFISPSRHGYGASSRTNFSSVMEMVDKSVEDFCELLDHLMIDKIYVIDARYGQRFASRFPDRTKALLCVNGTPLWHPSHLQYLPGRKRNMVKTSIYAPTAVRYLARVGQLLIQSGREKVFISSLNKENPTDVEALKKLDIYDVVEKGVRHVVAQGVEAHAWDVGLMHTDQSSDATRLKVPVSILYGEKFPIIPQEIAESYASLLPQSKVRQIKGAGTYLMHTHFDEVLRELEMYRQLSI